MGKKEALKKIKEKWNEDYFVELGIYQHLIECKQKFEMLKNHAVSPMSKEDLQYELEKELADLKILLDMHVKDDMIEERLNKFFENANKGEKK